MTVPLLLHNPLAVSMVIVAVNSAHLRQMASSVTVASQSVQLSGSRNLLRCRGWFGWFGWFEFFLGRPPFTLLLQQSFPVFHIPLVLCLFRLLAIFIGHLEQH